MSIYFNFVSMIYQLQGTKRRFTYIFFYELIAIAITSLVLFFGTQSSVEKSISLSVLASLTAVVWNFLFNYFFEAWELRQINAKRTIKRRVLHALGFEGGLIMLFVPLFSWWLQISFLQAFILDIGFLLFFLFYTFIFTWLFDLLFGTPNTEPARYST